MSAFGTQSPAPGCLSVTLPALPGQSGLARRRGVRTAAVDFLSASSVLGLGLSWEGRNG